MFSLFFLPKSQNFKFPIFRVFTFTLYVELFFYQLLDCGDFGHWEIWTLEGKKRGTGFQGFFLPTGFFCVASSPFSYASESALSTTTLPQLINTIDPIGAMFSPNVGLAITHHM